MAVSSTPRARKPRTAQPFTRKLLAWYQRAARDLPWRRTRPYNRRCCGELRIREAGAGGRHQRRPGDTTSVWKRETRNAERGTVAVGAGARTEEWQTSVEVQSSRDGARSLDLRGAKAQV